MDSAQPNSKVADSRRAITLGCRILAHRGLAADVLGHISARVGPDRLLVRGRRPMESGLRFTIDDDVREITFDGSPTDGDGWRAPSELPIHTAVLRARPDIGAVVHAHPEAAVIAAMGSEPLVPCIGAFDIPAARLAAAGIPIYPRAVLIERDDLGREVAATLGSAGAVILAGHGIVTVGATVEHAVVRAAQVDRLARLSLRARAAGVEPPPIDAEDLAALPDLGDAFNVETMWRHFVACLGADGWGTGSGS